MTRSLAFLAAVFALVLGSLLPFGAMAVAQPGHPLVLCSAEGPQLVQIGGDVDGPAGKSHLAKCAACVMPLAAALPAPPPTQILVPSPPARAVAWTVAVVRLAPPARAPPRPPSTAPPFA
jgi:hypothetical protein